MSENKNDDITRIEDLPSIENLKQEDEEDFQDLESMAQGLGIEIEEEEEPDQSKTVTDQDLEEESSDSFHQPDLEEDNFSYADDVEGILDDFPETDSESLYSSETEFTAESAPDDSHFEDNTNLEEEPLIETEDVFTPTEKVPDDIIEIKTEAETVTKTPLPASLPEQKEWSEPETFKDVSSFIEESSYGDLSAEGNPPFSIIIKNLKYIEDIEQISELLIECRIYKEDKREELKNNLNRGQILISRLSEFSAITLCHKLRSFDLEILMGLTEEVNPPKSYQSNDRGLTSKRTLLSNKKVFHAVSSSNSPSSILTSTLPSIDGYKITKALGIITHAKMIDWTEMKDDVEDELISSSPEYQKEILSDLQLKRSNNLAAHSSFDPGLSEEILQKGSKTPETKLSNIYQELVQELTHKVEHKLANGILGINFTISPINIDDYLSKGPKYQVICSGNMVCLEKV